MSAQYNGEYVRESREGLWCAACGRFWGEDAHMASYCCATDATCGECGNMRPKNGYCRTCYERREREKWDAAPKVDARALEGDYMIVLYGDDRYFRDVDECLEWCSDEGVAEPRMQVARPSAPPLFEVNEWLSDYLPDDTYADETVDERINALIRDAIPGTIYYPSKEYVAVPEGWRCEP